MVTYFVCWLPWQHIIFSTRCLIAITFLFYLLNLLFDSTLSMHVKSAHGLLLEEASASEATYIPGHRHRWSPGDYGSLCGWARAAQCQGLSSQLGRLGNVVWGYRVLLASGIFNSFWTWRSGSRAATHCWPCCSHIYCRLPPPFHMLTGSISRRILQLVDHQEVLKDPGRQQRKTPTSASGGSIVEHVSRMASGIIWSLPAI